MSNGNVLYLPWTSGRGAEPAARRGTTTRGEVWKCQIWQCKRHATPKSGLWLNSLLDVRALITYSTQVFFLWCYLKSIDTYLEMIYLNSCNIWVVLGYSNGKLHTILGHLGCIPAHIKYIQLLHSTDTLCLLRNQFYVCYIQYIVTQFQWDPIGNVPEANTFAKWVKNGNRGTCTWNSIRTDQYKIHLTPGVSQE
jgi:hypothetical protein